MQGEDKPRQTPLSGALDSLSSQDVTPGWTADAAWARIETRIKKCSRIPFWSYPLAAAAALLLCVMLLRLAETKAPSDAGGRMAATGIHSLERKAMETPPAVPAPQLLIVTNNKVSSPAISFPKKKEATPPEPEKVAALTQPQEQLSSKDTAPVIAVQVQSTSSYHRPPAVIYTLPEIMADVPEREAPPKRYSGILHTKSSADAPDGTTPRRRSGRGEYEAPGSVPIIIN